MDTWHDHFSITHFVLSALLNKRSNAGDLCSRAEAVLLTACEFCSAVATQ
jgi:hypothetical protein